MARMKRLFSAGFTLIELLIALSIICLILLLAGPIYGDMMGNAHIRNAGEAMLDGVRLAQTSALKNNLPTILTIDPATGWQITIDDPENPGNSLFTRNYVLAEGAPYAVIAVTPNGATQVTFDGLGRITPNADTSATIEMLDISHATITGTRPLRLIVSNTTNAYGTFLCDPASSGPPTACP